MTSFSIKKKSSLKSIKPPFAICEDDEEDDGEIDFSSTDMLVRGDGCSTSEACKVNGCFHAEQGRSSEALKCFQQAITLSPSNHILYELKAQVLLAEGIYLDAIHSCEKSIELFPSWSESHLTLARCFREFGEVYAALNSIHKALQFDPTSEEIRTELTEIGELVRRADAARSDHTNCLQCAGSLEEQEVSRCFLNLATRASVRKIDA